MDILSIFCPPVICLIIYLKVFNKKANVINTLSYYFLNTMLINIICLLVVMIFFGENNLIFTSQFTLKYIFLASLVSLVLPFIEDIVFKRSEKYIPNVKKIISNGYDKNKFSIIKMYKNNKTLFYKFFFLASGFLYFYLLEVVVRYTAVSVSGFGGDVFLTPFLMTLIFWSIFLVIQYFLPKLLSRIYSIVSYIFLFILFISNYMLLLIKSEALSVGELTNTTEGFKFLNFLTDKISLMLIVVVLLAIFLAVFNYINLLRIQKLPKIKIKFKSLIIYIVLIVLVYILGVLALPKISKDWDDVTQPRYYYDNFVNPKKSLAVLGLYEYTLRDIRISILENFQTFGSKDEIDKTISKYELEDDKNEYSGVFKNKNLIMIMMESIDYAIIDEEYMPVLTKLMDDSWTFPARYSALSSGGSTIQAEYASLSSLFYDTTYYNKIFKNSYNYSLPNMFNKNGYTTSSMHENYGTYYNRQKLHKSLGFDNSYFLFDIDKNTNYYDDTQMVDNNDFYKLIVPKDKDKFMSLMITIAAHGPYDSSNGVCAEEKQGMTQRECFGFLAKKTDVLLDHLLTKLEKDGLLDDTVILLYTDHQSYAYDYPKEYLDKLKPVDNDKNIKTVPFIIYNKGMDPKSFDDILVNDIDITPTLLNMFDIEYDPNNYLGKDVFSKDHKNLILFTDFTWYDGNIYSANAGVDTTTNEYKENTQYVADMLNLNSMILSNNYYGSVSKKKNK